MRAGGMHGSRGRAPDPPPQSPKFKPQYCKIIITILIIIIN
jgi:hypothetical protein